MVITSSNITSPSNSSFALTLEGATKKVGIFPARLFFENNVDVYWIAPENLTEELHLGSFPLAPIGVAVGNGRIKQQTIFTINSTAGFSRFTECEFSLVEGTSSRLALNIASCSSRQTSSRKTHSRGG